MPDSLVDNGNWLCNTWQILIFFCEQDDMDIYLHLVKNVTLYHYGCLDSYDHKMYVCPGVSQDNVRTVEAIDAVGESSVQPSNMTNLL